MSMLRPKTPSSSLMFPTFTPPSSPLLPLNPLSYFPPVCLDPGNLKSPTWRALTQNWPQPSCTEQKSSLTFSTTNSGANGAILASLLGKQLAVIKLASKELRQNLDLGLPPRNGCDPGTGVFTEFLVNLYIAALMDLFPAIQEVCSIPRIGYAQIEHPCLSSSSKDVATIQNYISDCTNCTNESLGEFPPAALSFLAIADILTLNTDRHIGNLLKDPSGRLVLIDHGYCLPKKAASGGRFCWIHCKALTEKIPEEVKQFIQKLHKMTLEKLIQSHCQTVNSTILASANAHLETPCVTMGQEQLLPHAIAVQFLKATAEEGWTLSDIGIAVQALPSNLFHWKGGVIGEIYETLRNRDADPFSSQLTNICQEIAANGPKKYQDAFQQAMKKPNT